MYKFSNSIQNSSSLSEIEASSSSQKPAYLYPFYGVIYFFVHSTLWKICFYALLLSIVLTLLSLFGFSLLIPYTKNKLMLVGHMSGWVSITLAIVFWLIESTLSVFLIINLIVLPYLSDVIFDETLKLKGYRKLVENKPKNTAGKLFVVNLNVSCCQLIVFVVTVPLNLLPILGTVLFSIINGYYLTWSLKLHFEIELLDLTWKQYKQKARNNKFSYSSFGAVACLLNLLPFINWFLLFTNVVGAALWSVDEYKTMEMNTTNFRNDNKI